MTDVILESVACLSIVKHYIFLIEDTDGHVDDVSETCQNASAINLPKSDVSFYFFASFSFAHKHHLFKKVSKVCFLPHTLILYLLAHRILHINVYLYTYESFRTCASFVHKLYSHHRSLVTKKESLIH